MGKVKGRSASRERKRSLSTSLAERISSKKLRKRSSDSDDSPVRDKSLSPGTKEILAYKKEKALKLLKLKKAYSDESDDEVQEVTPSEKPVDEKEDAGGNNSDSSDESIDEVERLRLQALVTLKGKKEEEIEIEKKLEKEKAVTPKKAAIAEVTSSHDDASEVVQKKAKKSKKSKDRAAEARELIESLVTKKKMDSDSDSEKKKKKKKKRKKKDSSSESSSDSSDSDSDSSDSASTSLDLKKAWEDIKSKWEKKIKVKKSKGLTWHVFIDSAKSLLNIVNMPIDHPGT